MHVFNGDLYLKDRQLTGKYFILSEPEMRALIKTAAMGRECIEDLETLYTSDLEKDCARNVYDKIAKHLQLDLVFK